MTLLFVPYFEKIQKVLDEINAVIQKVHPGDEMDRPGEFTSIAFYKSVWLRYL